MDKSEVPLFQIFESSETRLISISSPYIKEISYDSVSFVIVKSITFAGMEGMIDTVIDHSPVSSISTIPVND